ncbi:MAG: anti-sigma factor family protein [Pseudolabrys sp.]
MNCDEAGVLLHALIDGELDAGHAREVEAHVAGCAKCAAAFRTFRQMHDALASSPLGYTAPASLRARVGQAVPGPARASRRAVLGGFAAGATVSALPASGVLVLALRKDDQARILNETVSAHLRSLQADHLIDVQSSDQHTVKPWFNGRLDVAPPVIDLTAQGFTLIGGRLDYIDAKPVAVIVYRRRIHVINLFVAPESASTRRTATMSNLHGFNVRSWSENGFALWAVSDINADELAEFGEKFEATPRQ